MAAITPNNGRAAFITAQGPHTYWELNTANLGTNFGDDSLGGDNTAVASGDISTSDSYEGMNNQNDPPPSDATDIYIITDAAGLIYIPAGLAHGTNYGIFHNGGGTHAQSGFMRATTSGVEICCNHNNGGDVNHDGLIEEIPDADLPGWFSVGFQFAGNDGNQGDMGLWINGAVVRSATRTHQLAYGSGDPDFGNSSGREPNASTIRDPASYGGGDWSGNAAITSSGILLANFTFDNPDNDNTSPAGSGDAFYTDYHSNHVVAADTPLLGGAGVGSYVLAGADSGTAAATVAFAFDAFDTDAFDEDAFAIEAGSAATTITADAGSYALTGIAANTEYNQFITGEVGSYALSGIDAATTKAALEAAGVGSYALSGEDANTEQDEITTADVGSYTLSGTSADTAKATVTSAGVGEYDLTGIAASFITDELTSGGVGSYGLTGIAATTAKATVIASGVGSYALDGSTVGFIVDELLTAEVGSYALTGIDSDTSIAGGISFDNDSFDNDAFDFDAFSIDEPTATTLTADAGAYALSGTSAATLYDQYLSGLAGSYSLTGLDANTEHSEVESAGVGSYALSGASVDASKALVATAGVGGYALTGEDADTTRAKTTSAGVGSYALTGIDADTVRGLPTTADAGSYALTGIAVTTIWDQLTPAGVGSYVLSGKASNTSQTTALSFDNTSFDNDAFDDQAWSIAITAAPVISGEVGSYVLTGANASTIDSGNVTAVSAQPGEYSLTGTDVDLYPADGWTAFALDVDWIDLDPLSPFYGAAGLSGLTAGVIVVFDNSVSGYSISMTGTGIFSVSPDPVTTQFDIDYFFYDPSDGTAGTTEQITVLETVVETAGVGAYALTGADATTNVDAITIAVAGSYTLTGIDADTNAAITDTTMTAEAGSYSLSGSDVALGREIPIIATPGGYVLTGSVSDTIRDWSITADVGRYSIAGLSVTTIDSSDEIRIPPPIRVIQGGGVKRNAISSDRNRTATGGQSGRATGSGNRGRSMTFSKRNNS